MILVDKNLLMEVRFNFARLLSELRAHHDLPNHATKAQVMANAEHCLQRLEEALEQPDFSDPTYS